MPQPRDKDERPQNGRQLIEHLQKEGLVRRDALEHLRTRAPEAFEQIQREGVASKAEHEKLGTAAFRELVDLDVLTRLRDEGVVTIDGAIQAERESITANGVSTQLRIIFFINSFWIFAAYDF